MIDGARERVVTVTVTSRELWEPKLPPIAASLPVDPDAAEAAQQAQAQPAQGQPAQGQPVQDGQPAARPQLARGSKIEPTPETARLLRKRNR